MMGKVTKQQIEKWKEEYGGVYALPVDDKTAYLRVPTMQDFKRGFNALSEDGDIAFSEEMLKALWLDGDKEILEKDDYFSPARKTLKKLLEFEDAEIESLESKKSKITINGKSCVVRVITREDLRRAERSNPSNKTFVTQEKLFEIVCTEKDEAFNDRNNPAFRFPLYKAMETLQNQKIARLKKL